MNKMNCCNEKPIIALYSGEKLCKNHFNQYFNDKIFKTIRQFDLIGKEENLGIALSGGKDSLTVLYILNKLSQQNPKIKINAIAIDEGIAGYRDKTLEKAKEFCQNNNISLHIFSYKEEFGLTLDEMLKILDVRPCTICGIFRRYLLNKKSKELKLTKLATGHNLDDECQSILMNQLKNNIQASARLGPKVGLIQDEKLIGVIIYSDETNLSNSGHQHAKPLIISLANFERRIINKTYSKRLICYVPPIPVSNAMKKYKEYCFYKRKLYHFCIQECFGQLNKSESNNLFSYLNIYFLKLILLIGIKI